MNKMNNDLIEAADNFDRNFLLNNENLLFSNMEFFEKLFLYLIENKKNQTKYIQEDYDLILSLATEHGLTKCVEKLLSLNEFNFEINAETPFLKAIFNEYTDIIRLFLLHRNKETNDYLKSNKYVRKKVDFILLKYSIESF